MLAEIAEVDTFGELVLDEVTRRVREQHLAAVGRGADPRCPMNVEAQIAVVHAGRLTGVNSQPTVAAAFAEGKSMNHADAAAYALANVADTAPL